MKRTGSESNNWQPGLDFSGIETQQRRGCNEEKIYTDTKIARARG
jgi:hypothetical protein